MIHCYKLYARLFVIKDGFQSVGLLHLICQYIDAIAILGALLQVVYQEVEILVKGRLWKGIKCHQMMGRIGGFLVQLYGACIFHRLS